VSVHVGVWILIWPPLRSFTFLSIKYWRRSLFQLRYHWSAGEQSNCFML